MRVNIIKAHEGGYVVEVIDNERGARLELYASLEEVKARLEQVFV